MPSAHRNHGDRRAAYGVAAPHIFTLNTGFPLGVKYVGTTLTSLLGLYVLNVFSGFAERWCHHPSLPWSPCL